METDYVVHSSMARMSVILAEISAVHGRSFHVPASGKNFRRDVISWTHAGARTQAG
jgi:hypothetical protein